MSSEEHRSDTPDLSVLVIEDDRSTRDVERLNGQVEQVVKKKGRDREDLLREVLRRVQALRRRVDASSVS